MEKVQKELQVVVDEAYKGKRLKGFIKLDYDVNIIEIKVRYLQMLNKFNITCIINVGHAHPHSTIKILFQENLCISHMCMTTVLDLNKQLDSSYLSLLKVDDLVSHRI